MRIRVSPQWQVTIPTALRPKLGTARHMEARVERGRLLLIPVISDDPRAVAEVFRPEGVTSEVLLEAMDIIARRRRQRAEEEASKGP
jgi:hypothetical protein